MGTASFALGDEPSRKVEVKPEVAGNLPLALKADFDDGDREAWTFTDPAAWRIATLEPPARGVLELKGASRYEPPVRSPLNIALARNADVRDFVLDVDVRSTGRDYGHRDLCIFFGYQDPSHFYYVHLAKEADPHANSIFRVNGEPRLSIAEDRTQGTTWTDGWHHVRIVRKVGDGLIRVFFDDMATPVMTAHDQTFDHGQVGLGSFDDTGQFDALRVWGELVKQAEPKTTPQP
jgi:hypothetical protein